MAWPAHIFFFFETSDTQAANNSGFLAEGGRTWELDKIWSVGLDPPHHQKMQHHLHILNRGNDVCVINRDGTPSHHTTSDLVPNRVMKNIRNMKLFEGSTLLGFASGAELARFTLPSHYIEKAERIARYHDILDLITEKPRLKKLREIVRRR